MQRFIATEPNYFIISKHLRRNLGVYKIVVFCWVTNCQPNADFRKKRQTFDTIKVAIS
jgi:hypothetical protein